LREQKKYLPARLWDRQQRRKVAKVKIPLRLCYSAPLREQKKECLAKKGSRKERNPFAALLLCAFA
jgi:hypothetical protein